MRTTVLIPLAIAVIASACASAGPNSGAAQRNPDLITMEEVDRTSASNAYELIQRSRPSWLRTRGSTSILLAAPVRVYIDGTPFGGLEALRQISANDVERMERLGATEATQRFGTDHANGAIIVYTR